MRCRELGVGVGYHPHELPGRPRGPLQRQVEPAGSGFRFQGPGWNCVGRIQGGAPSSRKVIVRLPGKGNSNSHGARSFSLVGERSLSLVGVGIPQFRSHSL